MRNLSILLWLLCSCGNANVSNPKTVQEQRTLDDVEKHSCVFRTINSDVVKYVFLLDVFDSDTSALQAIFKTKPSVKIYKEKGIHDDNEYLYFLFETPNAFIKFFKNNEGFYIENALIKGDEVQLYQNCSIGMSKIDFFKQLSIVETVCDTIVISDEDQTLNLNFIFSKGYLRVLEIKTSE